MMFRCSEPRKRAKPQCRCRFFPLAEWHSAEAPQILACPPLNRNPAKTWPDPGHSLTNLAAWASWEALEDSWIALLDRFSMA